MPPNAPRSVAKTVFRSPGSTPLSTDFQISGRANRLAPGRTLKGIRSDRFAPLVPQSVTARRTRNNYGRSRRVAELGRGAPMLLWPS